MTTIRPATITDIEDCAKIYIQSYNQAPWNYNWTYDTAVKYLTEYIEVKQFVGFVLCEEDQISGAMFGHSKTWWTNNMLMVDELFIAGNRQGLGYGKKLLDHTQQYCKEHNLTSITLMTNKFMPAFKFYNNLDFILADQFVFMFKGLY